MKHAFLKAASHRYINLKVVQIEDVGLRLGQRSLALCDISYSCLNVYTIGVVREVNVRVLGKVLELMSAHFGRFEKYHLLFADDTALVADSE